MIFLSIVLTKYKARCMLGKEGESTNYLLFVNDLKLYGKDESELDSLAFIEKQDLSPLCKMCGEKEETDAVRWRRWITVRGTKLHEFTGTSQENILETKRKCCDHKLGKK